VFNLAFRYGNLPLARGAVAVMAREGFPHAGLLEMAEENWRGISAAENGWAINPALSPDSEET